MKCLHLVWLIPLGLLAAIASLPWLFDDLRGENWCDGAESMTPLCWFSRLVGKVLPREI